MKTNSWTQKQRKIFKKTNTVCYQCWSPRYIVSVLSTKCGGCHPKRLIVASLYKIKIIMITTLLFTRQFSFLLDKKKNYMKLTKNLGHCKKNNIFVNTLNVSIIFSWFSAVDEKIIFSVKQKLKKISYFL